jgi:hypothetical protein
VFWYCVDAALVARQFVDMTRIRLEGLLAAFPKLLGNDAKQHTYVETEVSTFVTIKHLVNDVTYKLLL